LKNVIASSAKQLVIYCFQCQANSYRMMPSVVPGFRHVVHVVPACILPVLVEVLVAEYRSMIKLRDRGSWADCKKECGKSLPAYFFQADSHNPPTGKSIIFFVSSGQVFQRSCSGDFKCDAKEMEQTSVKIIVIRHLECSIEFKTNKTPQVFLHPMLKYHIYCKPCFRQASS
jgi:hypothetical protein